MLSKVGASPREAEALMRHTDLRLTMRTCTDPWIFDLGAAVERLPSMLPAPEAEKAIATETAGVADCQNLTSRRSRSASSDLACKDSVGNVLALVDGNTEMHD
jgi:hypothetical protein